MGPKQNKKVNKNDRSLDKPQTPDKIEAEVEVIIPDYEFLSAIKSIESVEIGASCAKEIVKNCFKTITDNWVNGHLPQHCSLEQNEVQRLKLKMHCISNDKWHGDIGVLLGSNEPSAAEIDTTVIKDVNPKVKDENWEIVPRSRTKVKLNKYILKPK